MGIFDESAVLKQDFNITGVNYNLEKAQNSELALEEIQTERFYETLRSYYSYREGEDRFEFMTHADLLEYFYNDRSWRNHNTVSMGMDMSNGYGYV